MCFCHRFCLHFATKFNTKSLLMFWSHLLFESSNFKFRIPSLKEKDKCWGLFFIGLRYFFYWIVYVEKFNMIWSEHLVVDNNFLVGYHRESYFNPYLNLFFFFISNIWPVPMKDLYLIWSHSYQINLTSMQNPTWSILH